MIRQRHDPADSAFMSLTDLVPEAFRLADRVVRQARERAAASGLAVRCRKGCGVCCRYLVRISLPEALFLAERIQEMPHPRRGCVFARFGRIREVLQREWLYEDAFALDTGGILPEYGMSRGLVRGERVLPHLMLKSYGRLVRFHPPH